MYGWMTKSWLNSTEHRQQKAECAAFTEKFERGEVRLEFREITVLCNCRSFRYPHDPERHNELPGGDLDWRTEKERQGIQVFKERVR